MIPTAGVDDVYMNPYPAETLPTRGTAGVDGLEVRDPSVIPEDVKEYINKMHVQRQESHPDQNWRLAPAQDMGELAPYKRDSEMQTGEIEAETMPEPEMGFAHGGVVPNMARGGVFDEMLLPPGSGMLAPSPNEEETPPAAVPPMAPPPPVEKAAPIVPRGAPEDPTEADYSARADKALGLDQDQQIDLMRELGDRSQNAQIGAGIAGIGDAIASGGTLGKVNPGAMDRSQKLIKDKEMSGLSAMQTVRDNQGKSFDVAQKLQAQDPKSPLSRYAQKAYASLGKKIGLDLSNASAALIADITGKGVEQLSNEAEIALKEATLGVQRAQLAATVANQTAGQEATRTNQKREAAEATLRNPDNAKLGPITIPFTKGRGPEAEKARAVLSEQMGPAKEEGGPVKVNSQAEYNALPKGAHYVDSYGNEKVKR